MSEITGDWWLHFKISKVAKDEGYWAIKIGIEDHAGAADEYIITSLDIQFYAEIAISASDLPFNFTNINLGQSNNTLTNPSDKKIDIYAIANANYDIEVKASDSTGNNNYWVGQTYGDHAYIVTTKPNDGQIRLKIDNNTDTTDGWNVTISTAYGLWLNDRAGPTSDGSTSNDQGANHPAYLLLDIGPTGLLPDTYKGKIWFRVSNA